jgi:hypothetical protein
VHAWWTDQGLAEHPPAVGKRIARALLEQRQTSAKVAGIVVLHELLADHLRASDLPTFEPLFATRRLRQRGGRLVWGQSNRHDAAACSRPRRSRACARELA